MSKGQFCENCIHRIICDHENKYRKVCSQFLEQRPHGVWIETFFTTGCSICKEEFRVSGEWAKAHFNFCPNCGADMRERE